MRLLPARFELGTEAKAARSTEATVPRTEAKVPRTEDKVARTQAAVDPLALLKLQVVVSVALAVLLGVLAQRAMVDGLVLERGLVLWAAALATFGYGLWRGRVLLANGFAEQASARSLPAAIPLRLELALFGAVFAVSVFFHFYRIGSIPPGLNHDAAWEGLYAIKITKGMGYSPYVAQAWGRETLFHYYLAGVQLFLGPTWFAIKFASVTLGLGALVFFYLLMRRLFDWRPALVATFLLGVSGWHLTLDKVGWRSSFVPFFVALVFYFLVKAVQERRPRDFVLAGVFLGLSLDTYDAARILPFVAAVYLGYEAVRDRNLVFKNQRHLALFGVAALVAFLPLGLYALNHWDDYTGRGRFLWETQIQDQGYIDPLWTNAKAAFLMFNWRAGGDDFFVREPLLDMPVSVFFVLGLALSTLHWRQRPQFLLITMLLLAMVVGVVSEPNGNRNIVAIIPVYAFAGLFLYESWRWLSDAYPRYADWFTAALVGVLLYTAWSTYDAYLGPDRREIWGFYPETTRVGRYMDRIAPEYDIYAAAGNWPRDALTYLSYQGQDDPFDAVYEYSEDAQELLGVQPTPGRGTAFIVENTPENEGVLASLRESYPQAEFDQIYYPDGSETVIANVVLAPAGEEAAAPGDVPGSPQSAQPGSAERDAERRSELLLIAEGLLEYEAREGAFPDTGGNIQTACVYTELDAGCAVSDAVGADVLLDPREDGTKYGYWYESDGGSFVLYASLEAPVNDGETCTPSDPGIARKPNLLCLRGGE